MTFEVVQRETLHTKPGGPRIAIRSPEDRTQITEVDELRVNAMVTEGAMTSDEFWMELRLAHPEDPAPAFEAAPYIVGVIERNGIVWRNDGVGWYETDASPGAGMDPISARLLPQLLSHLGQAAPLESRLFEGNALAGISAVASRDDFPGVVASDGRDFTDPTFAVECWLDEQGRLIRVDRVGDQRELGHPPGNAEGNSDPAGGTYDLLRNILRGGWTPKPGSGRGPHEIFVKEGAPDIKLPRHRDISPGVTKTIRDTLRRFGRGMIGGA